MRNLPFLQHAIVAALLAISSAQSLAADYQYRMPHHGVRAGKVTPLPPGWVTPPPGGSGGTVTPPGGSGGTGTPPDGTGSTGGTPVTPPAEPTYATSGVQFLVDGAPITELPLEPGEAVEVTLRNTSSLPLRGWLLTSTGGGARADMTGTTCTQNTASTVPVTLQPGAQCTFLLIARMVEVRSTETFPFLGLDQQVIPNVLTLPGTGGGLQTNPDM